jgi:hypothetical protein
VEHTLQPLEVLVIHHQQHQAKEAMVEPAYHQIHILQAVVVAVLQRQVVMLQQALPQIMLVVLALHLVLVVRQ